MKKTNIKINDKIGVMTVKSINPFVVAIGGETYSAEIKRRNAEIKSTRNIFDVNAYDSDSIVASVELPEEYNVYGLERCCSILNTTLSGNASNLDSYRLYYPSPEQMKLDFMRVKQSMEDKHRTNKALNTGIHYYGDGQRAELIERTNVGILTETAHTFFLNL